MTERDAFDDWGGAFIGWLRQVVTIALGVFLGLMLSWYVARAYISHEVHQIHQQETTFDTTTPKEVVRP
jgi:hypothetical protein